MSTSPLLTEDEAAAILHISPRTLRDLRRRGEIRYVAITQRKIRYRPEDCEEYIASHVRAESPHMPARHAQRVVNRGTGGGKVVRFTQRGR